MLCSRQVPFLSFVTGGINQRAIELREKVNTFIA
jgi:hypothetical protein